MSVCQNLRPLARCVFFLWPLKMDMSYTDVWSLHLYTHLILYSLVKINDYLVSFGCPKKHEKRFDVCFSGPSKSVMEDIMSGLLSWPARYIYSILYSLVKLTTWFLSAFKKCTDYVIMFVSLASKIFDLSFYVWLASLIDWIYISIHFFSAQINFIFFTAIKI